jgi:uncharacterized protein (TIGR03437 family)
LSHAYTGSRTFRLAILVLALAVAPLWAQLTITTPSPLPPATLGQPYEVVLGATGGLPPYFWSTEAPLPPGLELLSDGTLTGVPTQTGEFNFWIAVFDEYMGYDQKDFVLIVGSGVTISPTGLPPGTAGTPYPTFFFTASGGSSPYNWSLAGGSLPGGMTLLPTGALQGTPALPGLYPITVRVIDAFGSQAQRDFLLTIGAPAQPLTITSTSPLPSGVQGTPYSFAFQASGGAPGYAWSLQSGTLPPGVNLALSGALSGTPTSAGTFHFTVRVTDVAQNSAAREFTLNVGSLITITSASPLPEGLVGVAYSFAFAATGGTPPYQWNVTAGQLPPGLTLAAAGTLSGTPTTAGTFNFSVTAAAGNVTSPAKAFAITIVPPLQITSTSPLPAGLLPQAYTFTFGATGGFPPYTWAQTGGALPAGLTLNAANGVLSGTPASSGQFAFDIRVTDSRGNRITRAFTLNIISPVTITTRAAPDGRVNQPYSQVFAATGGTLPYTWRLTGGIPPPGLTFTEAGVLAGTPTGAGPYILTIQVRDAQGATDAVTVSFRIAPAPLTSGTPALLPQAILNQPYSQTLVAQGGIPPYTWTLAEGSLPPGLNLTPGGEIRGTPTALGTFDFTVRLTDIDPEPAAAVPALFAAAFKGGEPLAKSGERLATTTLPFRLAVTAPPIAITTASPLPEGLVGSPYSLTMVATGGRAAIIWAVTSGALPPGLNLASSGLLSGVPNSPGTYTFTVQARDNLGPSALRTFTLVIRADADLVLSAAEALFRGFVGGGTPPPQSISVVSRFNQLTTYRVTAEPASWFTLISGAEASTPGRFVFAVNPAGLQAGTYRTNLRVESLGSNQVLAVPVTLEIAPAAPQVTAAPDLVQVNRRAPDENLTPEVVLRNAGGGGPLAFTAAVVQGTAWLRVDPSSGTLRPDGSVPVRFHVNPENLSPGYSRGVVRVTTAAGTIDIPVVVANPSAPRNLRLDPDGWFFLARQGNGALRGERSFSVLNNSLDAMPYSVEVVSGGDWLRVNKTGGTIPPGGADTIGFRVEPSALTTNNYYGRIRVTAPGALNSPLDFVAVLQVVPAEDAPVPDLWPSGLVFVAAEGGSAVAAQTVQLYASSNTPVSYQASTATEDRTGWLSVAPSTGVTSTDTPANLRVAVNPGNLKRGVYTGRVNVSLSSTVVRSVQVTAIITPAVPLTAAAGERDLTGCTPARLVATHTGLTGNFSSPVAWPTPLAVRVADDCGEPVRSAQVVASFSNGDPPLPLRLADPAAGVYSATWVPAGSARQLTITATASAPNLSAATAELIGAVTANRAPTVGRSGVLHAFFPQVGGPVAPGTLVEILGQNLAASEATATFPAPDTLNGVTVLISGRPAPLLFVSPTQINAQVPFGLAPETPHTVLVATGAALAMPQPLPLNAVQPGIASEADAVAVALRADGTAISGQNPARPGELVSLFLAGLGPTEPQVAAGAVSPEDPPARVTNPVTARVGGREAAVSFAGLAPGLVGVYRVTIEVPGETAAGLHEVTIEQGGIVSNAVRLPVAP